MYFGYIKKLILSYIEYLWNFFAKTCCRCCASRKIKTRYGTSPSSRA